MASYQSTGGTSKVEFTISDAISSKIIDVDDFLTFKPLDLPGGQLASLPVTKTGLSHDAALGVYVLRKVAESGLVYALAVDFGSRSVGVDLADVPPVPIKIGKLHSHVSNPQLGLNGVAIYTDPTLSKELEQAAGGIVNAVRTIGTRDISLPKNISVPLKLAVNVGVALAQAVIRQEPASSPPPTYTAEFAWLPNWATGSAPMLYPYIDTTVQPPAWSTFNFCGPNNAWTEEYLTNNPPKNNVNGSVTQTDTISFFHDQTYNYSNMHPESTNAIRQQGDLWFLYQFSQFPNNPFQICVPIIFALAAARSVSDGLPAPQVPPVNVPFPVPADAFPPWLQASSPNWNYFLPPYTPAFFGLQ